MSPGHDLRAGFGLATLELRRGASIGVVVLTVVFALAAAHEDAVVASTLDGVPLVGADGGDAVAEGLRRAGAFVAGLVVALPALALHAAGVASRWRAGDGDWLGARPVGQSFAFAASLVGIVGAAIVLTAVTTAAAGSVGGPPTRALVWQAGVDSTVRLEPGETYAERLDPAPSPDGALLRARVRNAMGIAPFADARLEVTRGDEVVRSEERIARRRWLELRPPAGTGPLEVRLECLGPGPVVVVGPRPLEMWRASGPAAAIDLALAGHALGALLSGALLAAALGAWLAPPLAVLGVVALAIVAARLGLAEHVPGLGLHDALATAREGRLPVRAPTHHAAVLAGLFALAVGLARPALGSWRHRS